MNEEQVERWPKLYNDSKGVDVIGTPEYRTVTNR